MTLEEFKISAGTDGEPPAGLDDCLRALWYARRGEWEKAHEIAQGVESAQGSLVHAYLHRVEGDLSNARYWYTRAGRSAAAGALEDEWENIARELL